MTTVVDPNKRRALGRGLDALLPTRPAAPTPAERAYFLCAVEKIVPQRGQPRRNFEAKALGELAESIKEHGIIEPLVVRKVGPDKFELIAGERRWRASQRAGLREVPVVVKDVTESEAFELALIENVQREDLNPVELAEALDRLIKEHGYTHETLASRLGKDRSTISNALRLLRLPPRVRDKVVTGALTEGHARSLLGLPDGQIEAVAEKVIRGEMSVRATEALVKASKPKGPTVKGAIPGAPVVGADGKTPAIRDLEARLTRALGTKVLVKDVGNKGEVVIPYADLDALDRLIDKLM
jgi:ParB family chromosome partitioning protein